MVKKLNERAIYFSEDGKFVDVSGKLSTSQHLYKKSEKLVCAVQLKNDYGVSAAQVHFLFSAQIVVHGCLGVYDGEISREGWQKLFIFGDWVVGEIGGSLELVADSQFQSEYEKVSPNEIG